MLLYPPENPIMCHYSKPLNDTFVVGCCKDYDLCNRDLKAILHVHNNTGKKTSAAPKGNKFCFSSFRYRAQLFQLFLLLWGWLFLFFCQPSFGCSSFKSSRFVDSVCCQVKVKYELSLVFLFLLTNFNMILFYEQLTKARSCYYDFFE